MSAFDGVHWVDEAGNEVELPSERAGGGEGEEGKRGREAEKKHWRSVNFGGSRKEALDISGFWKMMGEGQYCSSSCQITNEIADHQLGSPNSSFSDHQ